MPRFPTLAASLFEDYGTPIQVARLNETDLRALLGAYLQDYPALAYGFLANLDTPRIAEELANLLAGTDPDEALERCGKATILLAIRDALFENEALRSQVQAALDLQWSNRYGASFGHPQSFSWRQAS